MTPSRTTSKTLTGCSSTCGIGLALLLIRPTSLSSTACWIAESLKRLKGWPSEPTQADWLHP